MFRTLARPLAAALLLAGATSALAQAHAGRSQTRVGFGVGIEPTHLGSLTSSISPPAVGLYLPIQLTGTLRIEPSLGLSTFSQGTAAAQASGPLSWSTLTLGVAGHFFIVPPSPVGLYVGARMALEFERQKDVGGGANPPVVRTSATNLLLAGVLGGEYFVHHSFSVGAEAQLGLTFLGDRDIQQNGVTTSLSRDAALATNGVVYLRYFF
ncbi:MAG: outer membrane beta-barrel protein [Deltaproteobacteria bacterium]|nr:outer membrane beta-barrel protein [Deltaproteobacteria bacterium]